MRIGCLQFAPRVGDIDNNLNRADAVLNRADPDNLDLLVLPELAFTGYNFKSLPEISPYLEHSGSGISSLWARTIALKYDCTVIVGYPEKVDLSKQWPASPEYYNSAIVVNGDGETVANCRKTHLFASDEKWALENPRGFFGGHLVGLGQTAVGICMDLNPYQFQAPWDDFEFAHHVLEVDANLVVITMAWMTSEEGRMYSRLSQEPDIETLMYWITRLDPVIRKESEDEIIVVLANRTGSEDNAMYTGTSAVVGIKGGEVRLYGVLGRGEKDLLIVDTELAPFAKLVQRRGGACVEPYKPTPLTTEPAVKAHRKSIQPPLRSPEKFKDMAKPYPSPKKAEPEVSPQRSSKSRQSRSTKLRTEQKLVIDTSPSTIYSESAEDGNIRTPNYPSPTPHSIRPRLMIPPNGSLTAKYVEEQFQFQESDRQKSEMGNRPLTGRKVHADTPHPLVPPAHRPIQILGGDVTILKEGSTPYTSQSMPSISHFSEPSPADDKPTMSHFSDASPAEPRLFWTTSDSNGDFGRWWHDRDLKTTTKSDDTNFSENGSWMSSGISPVATHRAYPMHKAPAAQLNPPSLPPGIPKLESVNPPETIQEVSEQPVGEARAGRPASPKSRNASRSRGPDRPGSAIDPNMDLGHITKKLDEIAQRVSSAQGQSTPTHANQFVQARWGNQELITKAEVEELKALNISQPSGSRRRYGGGWHDSDEHHRSGSAPGVPEDRKKPEPNFLASSFQSRSRARSNSDRGRASERPGSQASLRPQQLSNLSQAQTAIRGRQPYISGENTISQNTPSRTANQSTECSSNRSRQSRNQSVEPIDLSQFVLIEEYPSVDCPMHGSRPASQARNHSSNLNGRTESVGPPRGSPPTRRAKSTDLFADAVELPLRPVRNQRASPSKTVGTEVTAPPETSSTGSLSPNSCREPRTPKALALSFEGDNSSIPESSLKCLERTVAMHISRPKSAIL